MMCQTTREDYNDNDMVSATTTTATTMRRRNVNNKKKREAMKTPRIVTELLPSSEDGGLTAAPDVPPAIICSDHAPPQDAASVDSGSRSNHGRRRRFNRIYESPPLLDRGTILAAGIFIFVLAMIWPPLILLFTYIASKIVPYSFRENDDAAKRRELYRQFLLGEDDDLPQKFRERNKRVNIEESYWTNERGMALCTCIMTPRHKPVTAVVCFCHGYTDHVAFAKLVEFQRLCEQGIALVAIEYEGHGRSDGPLGLINDWEELIDDACSYFKEVTSQRFPNHDIFLMGESMGGAVAYCTYNRIPELFRGVVFVCPMCKISDDMLPPQYVIDFLTWILGPSGTTSVLGYLPIAPSKNDLGDLTHRVKEKGTMSSRCPLIFDRNPRLATARELIGVTQRISGSLSEFEAPFLVLHGKADRVTDPVLSQALYDESKSKDKSIKLYDGMWHALTCGEPDENIDRVFADVAQWIQARTRTRSTKPARKTAA